jgi:hypothetical protein
MEREYRIDGPEHTTRWYGTPAQAHEVYCRAYYRLHPDGDAGHIPGAVSGDGTTYSTDGSYRIEGVRDGGYVFLESRPRRRAS